MGYGLPFPVLFRKYKAEVIVCLKFIKKKKIHNTPCQLRLYILYIHSIWIIKKQIENMCWLFFAIFSFKHLFFPLSFSFLEFVLVMLQLCCCGCVYKPSFYLFWSAYLFDWFEFCTSLAFIYFHLSYICIIQTLTSLGMSFNFILSAFAMIVML